MDNQIKNTLLNLYFKNPKGWSAIIRAKDKKYLIDALNNEIPNNISLSEKMYWLAYNLKNFPKCPVCGKNIYKFHNQAKGYSTYCCCSCAQLSSETRDKLKATNLKRYGTENPAQSKVIQQKMKNTCIERYGAENVFASDYGKQKIKETMRERYNVDNPQQNKEIKQKTINTIIQKYNVTCCFQLNKGYQVSKGELELFNFVKSINSSAIHNDRHAIWPMELDIYIESLKIGIEYDGDYWHSLPDMITRDYQKDKKCQDANIKLIRIKESDWLQNKDKIKQILQEKIYEKFR